MAIARGFAAARPLHCATSAKSSLMNDSDSPTYLDIISGPLTILGSRAPSAAPISRASSVLPQPGGPYSSMPQTGERPSSRVSAGGYRRDARARRTTVAIWPSRPPTRLCSRRSLGHSRMEQARSIGSTARAAVGV
eukprot:2109911-Prymnesium_polylepis.2